MTCPCSSGKDYEVCCKPVHEGREPKNALELMRARYAAYVLDLPEFIIKTTHPASPQYRLDRKLWLKQISNFIRNSRFDRLEILDFKENDKMAIVTFVAHMHYQEQDGTFTEKSFFDFFKRRWYYRCGKLASGHAPHLIASEQIQLLPIAYYGEPVLVTKAGDVGEVNDELKVLIERMTETMDAVEGIGLAAPQVHYSLRLFIARRPVETEEGVQWKEVQVYINPEISEESKERCWLSEGCLSVPGVHVDVLRPKEITIEYTNLEGKRVKERASGWYARVLQHETDHTNGILFIDRFSKRERTAVEPQLQALLDRLNLI